MAEHIVVATIVLVLSITATACRRIASYSATCMSVSLAIFLFNLFAKLLIFIWLCFKTLQLFEDVFDFGLSNITHILACPPVMRHAGSNIARLDMYA